MLDRTSKLCSMSNSQSQELHALVYRSKSVGDLTNPDLERLLVDAIVHNRTHSVTGALLYDGHRFFQYIEGPVDGIALVMARIEAASKHAGIEILFRGAIAERHFWNWSMACRHADASLVQRLEEARWTQRAYPHLLEEGGTNSGLSMLSEFWHVDSPAPC